jgi:hypothetical protein
MIAAALIANQRRAGFLAFGFGLLICWVMVMSAPRSRRRYLLISAVVGAVALAYGYVGWDAPRSPLTLPVYAARSVIAPESTDQRSLHDTQSSTWRKVENLNVQHTIQQFPLLGIGFGQQFQMWYREQSLDATGFWAWRYINHNSIYWLWNKVGAIGFGAFWLLIGSALILGWSAFRRLPDCELKVSVATCVALVAMEMIYSYGDVSLTVGRNMTALAIVLGLLASLDRMAGAPSGPATARQVPPC